jgi:hypothetical protein
MVEQEELREKEDLIKYYKSEYDKIKESYSNLENRFEGVARFEKTLGIELRNGLTKIAESRSSLIFAIWCSSIMISCAIIWGI